MKKMDKMEKIGNIAEFKRGPFGSSIKKSVCVPKGKNTYKLYEQGNVIHHDFNRGNYYLTKSKFEELSNFEIKPGDILITCAGTLGKIAIVPPRIERGIINSVLMRIKVNKKLVLRNYLYYYFQSPVIQNNINKQSAGVAIKNLFSTRLLKEYKIYLSSKREQQLIVDEIEKQFSRLDESIENLKEVKNKLEIYRKSILKTAFDVQGRLIKIKDLCKLINGMAFKASEWSKKGIPIIRIQNLKDPKKKYNYCDFKVKEKYYVNKGDLLFAWSGTPRTSFGAHVWERGKAVLNQHIFKIIINEKKVYRKYFLYVLNKSVNEFILKAHGTAGLAHITKNKFENHELILPEKNIQKQIVQEIESRFSVIDKLEETVNNSLKKAEQLRKSILKSAFEGKLIRYEGVNDG